MKLALFAVALLLFVVSASNAEDYHFEAHAEVDSSTGRIGDLFTLNLRITADSSLSLIPPSAKDGFGEFAVINEFEPSVKDSNEIKIYNFKYNIAVYNTGEVTLPPIEISAADTSGNEITTETDSIEFEILSVLPQAAQGDTLILKEIKPIVEFPYPVWYYALIAGIIVLIAALVYLYLRYRKRMDISDKEIEKPAEPPWVVAMKMLEELKYKKLLEKGEFKQFYFDLSEIGKFYVDRRFDFPAIEQTTFEIREAYNRIKPAGLNDEFIDFLEYADLVKFAKYPSSISIGQKWFKYVEDLVLSTKPERGITQQTGELEEVKK
ncbi:MAG: hypothetical protein GF315_12385 [candidate division Zixibacteria bacterium]|nr:hypothetical protein [candidate division Zixibacteria bacterium]